MAILLSGMASSQEITWKVEVSTDSILMGNAFEVRFTIENAAGEIEAPAFEEFELLSGPNTSSSYRSINGKVSQEASYTYLIRPIREGTLYIEAAYCKIGEEVYETEPISIEVYPNPEGIEGMQLFKSKVEGSFFHERKVPDNKPKFKNRKRKI
jgi:hypothetical protein